jgi:hypothetical protein
MARRARIRWPGAIFAALLAATSVLADDEPARDPVADLERGYAELLDLWAALNAKSVECRRLPPTPDAELKGEIDQLAQLLGTKPATDPMIRCWGRWSVDWNGRLAALRDRARAASPAPQRRGVEVMFSLLGVAASDLHLLWRDDDRRVAGHAADSAANLDRLRRGLGPVRKFLRDRDRDAADFEPLMPRP